MAYPQIRGRTYTAVDGRTYFPDPKPAIPVVSVHPNVIAHLKKEEHMSMVELYAMELFLQDGKRPRRIKSVPGKERNRIVAEYGLVYDVSGHRLMGSYDDVWAVISKKFPDETRLYKGYKECQYALRYGAQPCGWVSAK